MALVSSIAKNKGIIIDPLKAAGTHQGLESLDYRIDNLANVIEMEKYFNLYFTR